MNIAATGLGAKGSGSDFLLSLSLDVAWCTRFWYCRELFLLGPWPLPLPFPPLFESLL